MRPLHVLAVAVVVAVALAVRRLARRQRDLQGLLLGLIPGRVARALRDSRAAHRCLAEAPLLLGSGLAALVANPKVAGRMLTGLPPGSARGLRYGPQEHCCADVYNCTRTALAAGPIVIFVHGGVWSFSRRGYYRLLGQRIARRGLCCVVPGYQYYPDGDCFEQADCLGRLIDWIDRWRAGAPVLLVGHSSGAHISALHLLSPREPRPARSVVGFIGIGGVYDPTSHALFEAARGVAEVSPMRPACRGRRGQSGEWLFTDASIPSQLELSKPIRQLGCRVLLLHGQDDNVVPPEQSARLARVLVESGRVDKARVELRLLVDEGHAEFALRMITGQRCVVLDAVVKFAHLVHRDQAIS